MSRTQANRVGQFIGKYWIPALATTLGLSALVLITKGSQEMGGQSLESANVPNSPKDQCNTEKIVKLQSAASAASASRFKEAYEGLRECSRLTGDADYAKLSTDYEFQHLLSVVLNKSAGPYERSEAARKLESGHPQEAKKYDQQIKAVFDAQAKIEKQIQVETRRANEAERIAIAKKKRSEGVRLGMTTEDVLASSWGKPQSINRTQSTWGVSEQWVYGSGNYLYFKDGILETIQN